MMLCSGELSKTNVIKLSFSFKVSQVSPNQTARNKMSKVRLINRNIQVKTTVLNNNILVQFLPVATLPLSAYSFMRAVTFWEVLIVILEYQSLTIKQCMV